MNGTATVSISMTRGQAYLILEGSLALLPELLGYLDTRERAPVPIAKGGGSGETALELEAVLAEPELPAGAEVHHA